MTAAPSKKDHPLSMRLPEADIALIDRAAGLRGRSRTEFVRDAAVRAAEEVLLDTALIRMSPENFAAFRASIEGPAKVVPELVEVLSRRPPWASRNDD